MASAWNVAGRLSLLVATGLGFALINRRDPLGSELLPLYAIAIGLVVAGVAMVRRGIRETPLYALSDP